MSTPSPSDRDRVLQQHREEMRLAKRISEVLVVGLLLAVALLVVGGILAIIHPGEAALHVTSLKDMPGQLARGEAAGFLQLGLIVLLATPFARVLALGVAFALSRRWLFVGISVLVAAMLVLGTTLGLSLG